MTASAVIADVPRSTMAVLMLAVFTVSLGFGIVLPALPLVIEQMLGADGNAAQVSRATGLLTGLYTLSLFLFAPIWGRLSDRIGRRTILLTGLIGFSATSMTFAFIESLPAIYAERFLSGMFAAAVTPIALASIGDLATGETARARRLTFVSIAGISGFLLGPMMGLFFAQIASFGFAAMASVGTLAVPLAGTAALALMVAIGAAFTVPGKAASGRGPGPVSARPRSGRLAARLLGLSFIVSVGVGVFEVGLALRGRQELGLSPAQIAIMFTECSFVMLVVQAVVFSPWFKPAATRWLIGPGLATLAFGLFLVPRTENFSFMLVIIAAVAASAGILSPILTYWISSLAGRAQGAQLGAQSAAASLGAAVGAAGGGILFDVVWLPNASFTLAGVIILLGVILSLRIPYMLSPTTSRDDPASPRGAVV